MEPLILAASECDVEGEIICAPDNVVELFEFQTVWEIGPFDISRTIFLIFLAALLVILFLWFGLRKRALVPTKFGVVVESVVTFVRDDVAKGIIGPEGIKYAPYLLAVFMFVIIGNLFEVTPGVNFPITSRLWAVPAMIALITWVIFVFVGFKKNGIHYITGLVWPKQVPVALRPLVGLIELVSTFFLRPLTLAVRLFANLVAGHLMLVLLLGSGYIFLTNIPDIGAKGLVGIAWFAIGLGIFVFEIVVSVLQAYIITLLSAVYIESSINPAH